MFSSGDTNGSLKVFNRQQKQWLLLAQRGCILLPLSQLSGDCVIVLETYQNPLLSVCYMVLARAAEPRVMGGGPAVLLVSLAGLRAAGQQSI